MFRSYPTGVHISVGRQDTDSKRGYTLKFGLHLPRPAMIVSSALSSCSRSRNNQQLYVPFVVVGLSRINITVQEFQAAISDAKRGKLLDARLSDCIRRIDHVLRLQHLRIHDVFRMMVRWSTSSIYEKTTTLFLRKSKHGLD